MSTLRDVCATRGCFEDDCLKGCEQIQERQSRHTRRVESAMLNWISSQRRRPCTRSTKKPNEVVVTSWCVTEEVGNSNVDRTVAVVLP